MTPLLYRLAGYVLTGLVLIGLLQGYIRQQTKLADQVAVAQQGQRSDKAVSGMVEDLTTLDDEQAVDTARLGEARQEFKQKYTEVLKNDPIARTWADAPIPDRLREQARQRRLARERLGCVGDGCGNDGADERPRR